MIGAIQNFFATGALPKEWNVTIITLIPKIQCPTGAGDYRPISYCNVIYKRISKLICSKLKLVLGSIISPNQGAFVEGRSIIHNILLCQDIVKHYGRKYCMPSCLLKMDFRKAYDTLNWDFLKDMMVALNFPRRFTKIVMSCVTSTQYSLMFNGSLMDSFKAKRGVRQGDPMSPLLFVIGMEYLSRILKVAGGNEGFSFHPRCLKMKLNHLVFADDLMMFYKGDLHSIMILKRGVETFSDSSGLCANNSKSGIYRAGVNQEFRNQTA